MERHAVADEALVHAVLAGDREAFGELVAPHQARVAGVAWRYGVRREEIEDVVSEVFLKTFERLHLWRPEAPFGTWLYRVAANHVLDRGRRARRAAITATLPEELADGRHGAAVGLERDERAALVRAALARVPARYREALFLVYVEELSLQETASTLGVPLGTIKSRLLRGRQALARLLVRSHPEFFGGDLAQT